MELKGRSQDGNISMSYIGQQKKFKAMRLDAMTKEKDVIEKRYCESLGHSHM